MRWFMFAALFLFSIPPTSAGGLADNPAFCFGFLTAQSQKEPNALRARKEQIHSLFGKSGPKDSTDERRFSDWEKIGRDTASKPDSTFLKDCRKLLSAERR